MATLYKTPSAIAIDEDVKHMVIDEVERAGADEAIMPDPREEKRLVRKVSEPDSLDHYTSRAHSAYPQLDMLIMPTVAILYLLSNLDRGNLGNAQLLGLIGPRGLPLDPDGSQFGLLVSVFFIGYSVLGESPRAEPNARPLTLSHSLWPFGASSRPTRSALPHRRSRLGCGSCCFRRSQHLGPSPRSPIHPLGR